MSKISVIVTTYNIEDYIEKCLESVLSQEHSDLEVIVVDDGSTDSTPSIIQRFSQLDPRVIPVLMEENTPGGVATGANIGLGKATGEWIGFVDGDDWCEPYMFSSLYQHAIKTESELVIGDFRNYNQNDGSFYDPSDRRHWLKPIPKDKALSSTEDKKKLLKFNPVPWRKLYSSSLIERNNIRYPEGDYFYEDNPFHWFCISKAKSVSILERVVCYHRMNRVGQTMATGDSRLLAFYDHHDTIYNWLKSNKEYGNYKEELVLWVVNNTCWIYDSIEQGLRGDVLSRLGKALNKHDYTFVLKVINSQHMGNKGHGLAELSLRKGRAAGPVLLEGRAKKLWYLMQETRLYYKNYGAKETIRKIYQYVQVRSPVKLNFMSNGTKKNSMKEFESDIKSVRQRLEFSDLIRLLDDETKGK
ncbi:glycosyltransferase family 2 protein [Salinicola salarius]|uniref:glycosyltransferase family 2 protein n=1 Tax=Salinicola salarius TaxID=430457 RepID=UPI0023E40E74|nr:glycosyltransferase family 2 protein [Salinicola salarius]MDF3918794.1 glycosyltransferase family 2 protein [Salinicola salarius]